MTLSSAPPPAASWRDPAGWPLRTRLVAIMIVLLALLGLVVGATTEIYLNKTLYSRVDSQLADANERLYFGGGGPGGRNPGKRTIDSFYWLTSPGPGTRAPDLAIAIGGSSSAPEIVGGGIVTAPKNETTTGSGSGSGNSRPEFSYTRLNATQAAALAKITPDGRPVDVDLGSLGDYRVQGSVTADGYLIVSGVSLGETQSTLLQVAMFTGGAVLIMLVVAGWTGAIIIRRTLQPLSRVAATATKVSELELDRGEVDLAQRVPAGDTDMRTEVGQVGAALNRMLDHVGNALEARHASEMQVRQFVADASHELRTPLAAIRGYAELSRRSRQPVPEEISHVLRRVESEAQRMTALVEDLLLLARLDAGRPLAHDPVDLTMLVVDAVSDAHAAGPGHDWQLDLPEEPVSVIGDQQRLHQVLANLLANARTHTPEGTTVTVGVSATTDQAVIRVCDAGPGIPEALQPKIFERFARGDSSRSRAAGSTGLGLSIVHAVVTSHGGTVSMQSKPGQTTFTVQLPLVLPAAEITTQDYARPIPMG